MANTIRNVDWVRSKTGSYPPVQHFTAGDAVTKGHVYKFTSGKLRVAASNGTIAVVAAADAASLASVPCYLLNNDSIYEANLCGANAGPGTIGATIWAETTMLGKAVFFVRSGGKQYVRKEPPSTATVRHGRILGIAPTTDSGATNPRVLIAVQEWVLNQTGGGTAIFTG